MDNLNAQQTQNALHEGAGEGTRQIEEELAATLLALHHAENQLEQQWSPPGELQAWLQLTHELELEHYTAKRQAAERQYQSAKESVSFKPLFTFPWNVSHDFYILL